MRNHISVRRTRADLRHSLPTPQEPNLDHLLRPNLTDDQPTLKKASQPQGCTVPTIRWTLITPPIAMHYDEVLENSVTTIRPRVILMQNVLPNVQALLRPTSEVRHQWPTLEGSHGRTNNPNDSRIAHLYGRGTTIPRRHPSTGHPTLRARP